MDDILITAVPQTNLQKVYEIVIYELESWV